MTRRRKTKIDQGIECPATPLGRVLPFFEAFYNAPDDTDVELRVGRGADGTPAVCVRLLGKDHGLCVDEARSVAAILEDAMHKFPGTPEVRGFPNMIMSLRAAADKAEGR